MLLLAVLVIVAPFTAYLTKAYFTLTAELEITAKQKDELTGLSLSNHSDFSSRLDQLSQSFLNNRYILNNTESEKTISVESICKQHNGINCVLNEAGKLRFVGDHRA